MITCQEPRLRNTSVVSRKKFETAKEIEEFSSTFVVSEDLVITYVDHLKHLEFFKSLRNKATTEKRQNRETKTYEDYNWNELVLTGGLSSLYVCELNTYLKKTLTSMEKKLKNEKITTIATHLKEACGPLLASLSIRGELLLQDNKPAFDDEESDEDEDVLGETWSTECTESEETSSSDGASSNESDGSDSEHAQPPAKRSCFPEVEGIPQALHFVSQYPILLT